MDLRPSARGWYPDPYGSHQYRWWDGKAWTSRAVTDNVEVDDPVGGRAATGPGAQAEAPALPGGFVAAVLAYGIGVGAAFVVATLLAVAGDPGGALARVVATQLALWTGLVGATVFVSRRSGSKKLVRDFNWQFRWSDIGYGLVGAASAREVAVLFASLVPITPSHDVPSAFGRAPEGYEWAVLTIITCIGAPLVEELFFRGLLQPRVVERLGPIVGVLVTAGLFGAAHLIAWSGRESLVYVAAVTGAGVVFGMLRHLTGRLGPSTAAHALFNLQALVVTALLR